MANKPNFPNAGNQHIIYRGDGTWGVRGAGNSRDTSHHSTQQAAFAAARRIAQNQGGDTVIHRRDNAQIRDRNTYGKKDPFPPKG